MSKNIVLVGLMGSGKTTVGNLIAEKLDRDFIDVDDLIEKEAHKSINDIFKLYGEALFRKLEAKIICKISPLEDQVISTGGGAVEDSNNIENLKRNGVLFYLEAPPAELYKRVRGETNRPLLNNSKPLHSLEKLLEKREKFYNLADVKINTVNKHSYDIVDKIIEAYNEYEKCHC